MLFVAFCCAILLISPAVAPGASTTKSNSGSTDANKASSPAKKSTSHKKKHSGKKSSKRRGQSAIDSGRAQQIQEALIREHYLKGEPSGKWDDATQAAMRRYQSDHGWQNKTIPDSRALINLGLGPNQDHLLNPETAMTSLPEESKTPAKPVSADPPAAPPTPADTKPAPQR